MDATPPLDKTTPPLNGNSACRDRGSNIGTVPTKSGRLATMGMHSLHFEMVGSDKAVQCFQVYDWSLPILFLGYQE